MTGFWEGLTPPYSTIVADPPWHYEGFAGSVGRGGEFAGTTERAAVKVKALPYGSLTVAEIAALPVAALAGPDAFLFLWTTNRYLPDAFAVLTAWGFRYRQTLVWHKTGNPPPFGGTVAPNHAEFLLVASCGSPPIGARLPGSVIAAPKQNEHSRKPATFLDLVETVSPGPRCELFSRRPQMGWDSWGRGYELPRGLAASGSKDGE